MAKIKDVETMKSTIFGIFHPRLLLKLVWPSFDVNLHHVETFDLKIKKPQKLCKKREFQNFQL